VDQREPTRSSVENPFTRPESNEAPSSASRAAAERWTGQAAIRKQARGSAGRFGAAIERCRPEELKTPALEEPVTVTPSATEPAAMQVPQGAEQAIENCRCARLTSCSRCYSCGCTEFGNRFSSLLRRWKRNLAQVMRQTVATTPAALAEADCEHRAQAFRWRGDSTTHSTCSGCEFTTIRTLTAASISYAILVRKRITIQSTALCRLQITHTWWHSTRYCASRFAHSTSLAVLLLMVLSGCAALTNPVANGVPVRFLPDDLLAESREGFDTIPLTRLRRSPPDKYILAARDTLGIYIEGVLGSAEAPPPVNVPESPNCLRRSDTRFQSGKTAQFRFPMCSR